MKQESLQSISNIDFFICYTDFPALDMLNWALFRYCSHACLFTKEFFIHELYAVEGDEFVRDPVKFSNQSTIFDQAFSDFSPGAKKGLFLLLFFLL